MIAMRDFLLHGQHFHRQPSKHSLQVCGKSTSQPLSSPYLTVGESLWNHSIPLFMSLCGHPLVHLPLKATLVNWLSRRVDIAPHLLCQRREQAHVAASVLELVEKEVKRWLAVSTWHLIYSCKSLGEHFPGLCSCWWMSCVFPGMFLWKSDL